jgi:hypothetical protein
LHGSTTTGWRGIPPEWIVRRNVPFGLCDRTLLTASNYLTLSISDHQKTISIQPLRDWIVTAGILWKRIATVWPFAGYSVELRPDLGRKTESWITTSDSSWNQFREI